ncbi:MAG: acyl-CoA thioesterase [Lentisphaerae bacterium]|nr:acyl-CoA thioesterase [Lentisphaerota bacterium]
MSDRETGAGPSFLHRFTVPADAIDENGHVNNVVYIQWMQDSAIRHAAASGGTAAMRAAGCTWLVRSHKIEYLSPAYPGDCIEACTWVEYFRGVRSLRQYRFVRTSDSKLLARGETMWVSVSASTGRPHAIPVSVIACFLTASNRECPESK